MLYLDIINIPGYKVEHFRIRDVIEQGLKDRGFNNDVELAVMYVNEQRMSELHEKYMGDKQTTDVLSFPLEKEIFPDGVIRLGDIVICIPVAERQAKENDRSVEDEVLFLADHGLKHLFGEHHE